MKSFAKRQASRLAARRAAEKPMIFGLTPVVAHSYPAGQGLALVILQGGIADPGIEQARAKAIAQGKAGKFDVCSHCRQGPYRVGVLMLGAVRRPGRPLICACARCAALPPAFGDLLGAVVPEIAAEAIGEAMAFDAQQKVDGVRQRMESFTDTDARAHDAASDADRDRFKARPERATYLRMALPGEVRAPIGAGKPLLVAVRQVEPGWRVRAPFAHPEPRRLLAAYLRLQDEDQEAVAAAFYAHVMAGANPDGIYAAELAMEHARTLLEGVVS